MRVICQKSIRKRRVMYFKTRWAFYSYIHTYAMSGICTIAADMNVQIGCVEIYMNTTQMDQDEEKIEYLL